MVAESRAESRAAAPGLAIPLAPQGGYGIVPAMRNRGGIRGVLAAGLLAVTVPAASAAGSNLTVVASFYPITIATLNVIGDTPGVSLHSMAQPGAGCLHDYQTTTDDMVALAKADVFVVNGAGMESFLDRAIRRAPRMKVVDASRGVELLRGPSGPNPHVWVSVARHIRQVVNIAEGLGAADPAHAEHYQRNAAAYTNRLESLRLRMHAGLDSLASRDIVTFHEAFPYFADEFGLRVATVIEREPGSEPGGRELARTVDIIRRTGVKALFVEPQYSPKVAAALARETGAGVYTLDPVVTGPVRADAYLEAMDSNLAALRRALK